MAIYSETLEIKYELSNAFVDNFQLSASEMDLLSGGGGDGRPISGCSNEVIYYTLD